MAEQLEAYTDYFYREIPQRLEQEKKRLTQWVSRIPAQVQMRLQQEHFRQERFTKRMAAAWQARLLREEYRLRVEKRMEVACMSRLQRELHRIELMEQKTQAASPELLLKKGYSITLKDGKAVTDASTLKAGDKVVTRMASGEVESIVEKINLKTEYNGKKRNIQ